MGCTPWERIKILKGFLEGRVRAVALEESAHLQHDSLIAEMAYLKTTGAPEHEQMRLQAKIVESISHMVVVDEAYELNRQEIKMLNRLLAECYEMAEPTRIEGYTDEEMFEANAAIQAGLLPVEAIPILTAHPPMFAVQEMAALNATQGMKLEELAGEE